MLRLLLTLLGLNLALCSLILLNADRPPAFTWIVFAIQEPYDQQGIYRIKPDGSDLKRLTNHPVRSLKVSPNGFWIAYVNDYTYSDLYLIDINGEIAPQIAQATDFSFDDDYEWHPSSQWLAFSGVNTFYLANILTGQTTTILPHNVREIEWAADGKWLYIIAWLDKLEVHRLRPTGTHRQRLTNMGLDFPETISVSPDGQSLVYTPHNSVFDGMLPLYIMRPDGSDSRVLTEIPVCDLWRSPPTWSPDSRWFNVHVCNKDISGIWRISVADGSHESIAPLLISSSYIPSPPHWAADGQTVLIAPHSNPMAIWDEPAFPLGQGLYTLNGFNRPELLFQLPKTRLQHPTWAAQTPLAWHSTALLGLSLALLILMPFGTFPKKRIQA